jgi:small subunit ribosomal protein S5
MTEEKKQQQENKDSKNGAKAPSADSGKPEKKNSAPQSVFARKNAQKNRSRKAFDKRKERPVDEFDQQIVDLARVTRVMAGGKRMRFRACVAIGNRKGKVSVGIAKGADVTIAVTKAVTDAKKKIISIPIINGTIPHEIFQKEGAAKVLLKPAKKGRGVIAGGAVRMVLALSGIENITSKNLGTNNKVNIARCTVSALANLKKVESKKSEKTEKIKETQAGKDNIKQEKNSEKNK